MTNPVDDKPGKKNQGFSVLIVDDIPTNFQVAATILQKEGYRLFFAQDGETALQLIKTQRFDLILLDVMMPRMNGFQVCRLLKEDPDPVINRIPVIFLTAKSELEDIVRGFDLGAVDYVVKPFNGSELVARVKTHLQLKHYREELEELNAAKDKFFSIVAHDLKDPMQSITLGMEMLKLNYHHFSAKKQMDYITRMCKNTRQLSTFLDNLLEWARSQQGAIDFHPSAIDLSQLAAQCIQLLGENAETKNIRLASRVSKNTLAFADRHMVETVLRNLISNAIKFTHRGGSVTISSRKKDNYTGIAVSDNGIGMTPEAKSKLFKLEFQLSTPGTANEKGTGLGLILCDELIRKNNGTISVTSEPDRGSRFTFHLPRNRIIPQAKKPKKPPG
ncbi:MAG: hybrid sensor histidine kinase/response regulator [bacterium]|nr:hybrid sensor histidine kinase/response regulator [bacterium]